MPEEKFPAAFYESHEILTCPNGDKLRSDDEGLFCWLEGRRVPVELVRGRVELLPMELPAQGESAGAIAEVAQGESVGAIAEPAAEKVATRSKK